MKIKTRRNEKRWLSTTTSLRSLRIKLGFEYLKVFSEPVHGLKCQVHEATTHTDLFIVLREQDDWEDFRTVVKCSFLKGAEESCSNECWTKVSDFVEKMRKPSELNYCHKKNRFIFKDHRDFENRKISYLSTAHVGDTKHSQNKTTFEDFVKIFDAFKNTRFSFTHESGFTAHIAYPKSTSNSSSSVRDEILQFMDYHQFMDDEFIECYIACGPTLKEKGFHKTEIRRLIKVINTVDKSKNTSNTLYDGFIPFYHRCPEQVNETMAHLKKLKQGNFGGFFDLVKKEAEDYLTRLNYEEDLKAQIMDTLEKTKVHTWNKRFFENGFTNQDLMKTSDFMAANNWRTDVTMLYNFLQGSLKKDRKIARQLIKSGLNDAFELEALLRQNTNRISTCLRTMEELNVKVKEKHPDLLPSAQGDRILHNIIKNHRFHEVVLDKLKNLK